MSIDLKTPQMVKEKPHAPISHSRIAASLATQGLRWGIRGDADLFTLVVMMGLSGWVEVENSYPCPLTEM